MRGMAGRVGGLSRTLALVLLLQLARELGDPLDLQIALAPICLPHLAEQRLEAIRAEFAREHGELVVAPLEVLEHRTEAADASVRVVLRLMWQLTLPARRLHQARRETR
jgi:hypothetical protein